jgi:hypothetical protein
VLATVAACMGSLAYTLSDMSSLTRDLFWKGTAPFCSAVFLGGVAMALASQRAWYAAGLLAVLAALALGVLVLEYTRSK